ncbi:N-acetyl-gamma-glutamyl-phosphate reductase [Peribacillus saganii]|uniref:N-acetyl-gamma-glutamyl-phosphate reductase n=1 Tax=Peribacillus saganii TaxID=2303992 RepID=A0A372LLW3_9BACI|nr:N-acetyl-gamma-glutamyl-phosphate reductase [Peribacillus saganii]RFU68047.1 N-acetyl-gamma-glutamyl-phosphate reductase [Peribacillus saganii]
MKVSIIGASGYGGLELIRLLTHHPHFHLESLHTSSMAGVPIGAESNHLAHLPYILEEIDPEKIAKTADIVFLATPTGISKELAPSFHDLGVKLIDLSGDLRLKKTGEYEKWYKGASAPAKILNEAVYGLSEWNQKEIEKASVIANPGCYPTATLLGLAPLFMEGLAITSDIIVDAKSGVSGAGKSPTAVTHFSDMNDNFKIYKVHQHQHIPEIEQQLGEWAGEIDPVSFNTHLVPMTRGIMATMYVKLKRKTTTHELLDLYKTAYENQPFVRIQPEAHFPCTKQVYGSNFCDIGVAFDERTNKATIVSVIDNLMKGAAGQAVQNANILIGADPSAGLMQAPLYP